MLSPNETVKEVAKLLVQDHFCYVERKTRKVTAIEVEKKDTPETEAIISPLEQKIDKYIKVMPMSTQKLLFTMEDFLAEVTDHEVKKELHAALKRKKPTRNFLQIVESRYDIQQHWTLFKAEQYEEYVKQIFVKDYNY